MTIAFDAASVLSADSSTFRGSWTHTPVGTPKGVFVTVGYNDIPDRVTGVTYGGVALTRIAYRERDSGGQSVSQLWFRGSGIPTGQQTVVVSGTNDNPGSSSCITVTALGDTAISDVQTGAGTGTDMFATLATNGRICLAVASCQPGPAGCSGTAAMAAPHLNAYNANGYYWSARQATPSATPISIGATQSSADYSFAVANAYDTAVAIAGMPLVRMLRKTWAG